VLGREIEAYLMTTETSPEKKTYWIRFHYSECPVCGRGDEERERVYDEPKPEDVSKRHIYHQHYDWCVV